MNAFLIINADDFGLTPGVNRGIVRAFQRGVLTSATLMANGLAWREAVAAARANPGLGVGVHLTLTALEPVLPPQQVPSLVDGSGCFRRQFWRAPLWKTEQVRAEWRAQISRLVEAGLEPTHLDSHHHVHLWPPLVRVAWQLAREFSIPAIRVLSPAGMDYMDVSRRERLLVRWAWRWARKAGALVPHTVAGLEGVGYPRAFIEAYLADLGPGIHELFCHPGLAGDSKLVRISSLTHGRQRELAIICSPWLRRLLVQYGVELVNYNIFWEVDAD